MNIKQEPKYDAIDGQIVNRSTGEPILSDEPIFIFRAKDINTLQTLAYYMETCKDETHKKVIGKRINDFADWQNRYFELVKEPDSDSSLLT